MEVCAKPETGLTREDRRRVFATVVLFSSAALLAFLLITNTAWADTNDTLDTVDYQQNISTVLTNMIGIIATIFQAVGVVLSVYAVGQLILSFKNEDPNSKSQASMLLVVGVALITVPAIIKSLGLENLLGTGNPYVGTGNTGSSNV